MPGFFFLLTAFPSSLCTTSKLKSLEALKEKKKGDGSMHIYANTPS
jgi:hypothetical protein